MKWLFPIILLLSSISLSAQYNFDAKKISTETNSLVKILELSNSVDGEFTWPLVHVSEAYKAFVQLSNKAKTTELIELTRHYQSEVRCYAFWALCKRKSDNLFSLLLEHLNDIEVVTILFDDDSDNLLVGDFFIWMASVDYLDKESKFLTKQQLEKLDSILLSSDSKLFERTLAIERLTNTEENYSRIKQFAVVENHPSALIKLASYKKEEDIELIKNFKNGDHTYPTIYNAITEFPHPDFFPFLQKRQKKTFNKNHHSGHWKFLYQAIAAYQNKEAYKAIILPFTKVNKKKIRPYHIKSVKAALEEYLIPLYTPILWKLWEEEKEISKTIFLYLKEVDEIKAMELTKRDLAN